MHRRYYVLALALAVGLMVFAPGGLRRSDAMPVFGQAYGLDCKVCHTMVPALTAYGRYVQRTMYGALDPEQYKGTFPLWIGENVNYDSTSDSPKAQVGNLAAHYVGVYPAWTSHVQQWILQNNDTGGPFDTGWVSYNNLFKQSGHIVIGKMPTPGPSFLSMWFDLAPFAGPQMAIGEHVELVGANRWGAKFSYATPKMVGEAGYYGSTGDLNGATDWSPNNDKGVAYHLSFGNATKPVVAGIVGNFGSFPLAEGGVDRYGVFGAYVQADPSRMFPGAMVYWQNGNDGNPTASGVGAHSNAYSAELFAPLIAHRDDVMVSVRREMTNDGLGTITQYGYANLSIKIFRYLRAYGQITSTSGSTPTYQYMLWWTTPLVGKQMPAPLSQYNQMNARR